MKLLIVVAIFLYVQIIATYVTMPVSTPATNVTVCGNLTCFNNAKCDNRSKGNMFCMCQRGYQGSTCDKDMDECTIGDPCFRRGNCQNIIGSYRCSCFKGWLGEDVHCALKDNTTTVRECAKGWFGEWCSDQCLNDSMCKSHEVCLMHDTGVISESGHICRCAPGWHGRNCTIDKDECKLKSSCPVTASCINNPGSFSCPCLSGWEGTKCNQDIDECVANPCQHSSNCTNTPGSYNCTCAEGWKGHNCEEDIDECVMNNPCNVSTYCENVPGSFTCTNTISKEQSASGNVYIIVGAVVGTVFVMGCIAIGLYVIKRKSRKVNTSVDSQLEDLTDNHHKQSNNASSNEEQ